MAQVSDQTWMELDQVVFWSHFFKGSGLWALMGLKRNNSKNLMHIRFIQGAEALKQNIHTKSQDEWVVMDPQHLPEGNCSNRWWVRYKIFANNPVFFLVFTLPIQSIQQNLYFCPLLLRVSRLCWTLSSHPSRVQPHPNSHRLRFYLYPGFSLKDSKRWVFLTRHICYIKHHTVCSTEKDGNRHGNQALRYSEGYLLYSSIMAAPVNPVEFEQFTEDYMF